jgi:hypothetical protein
LTIIYKRYSHNFASPKIYHMKSPCMLVESNPHNWLEK